MTQIATDKEQSARLVACGVHSKGADMTLSYNNGVYELIAEPYHYFCFNEEDVPAWSLSVLLALMPQSIKADSLEFDIEITAGWRVSYVFYDDILECFDASDPIECCVQAIEWLTANNYKLNNNE